MILGNNWPKSDWEELESEWFNEKYQLVKFVGEGAFGAVFTVNEVIANRVIRNDQEIVIKVIPIDQNKLDQQIRELQLGIRLKHPNLINCDTVEQGRLNNRSFLGLVMELAEISLQEYVFSQPSQTLSLKEVKEIIQAVASGLNYLHAQLNRNREKIVHRDIKGENILKGKNQKWKITDFGLSSVLSFGKTRDSTQLKGTPAFFPPESYNGIVSTAWDLWSLGIMITELLSGKHPFPATTEAQLMRKVLMDEADLPSNLERSLKDIIEGCLIKDYKQRWTARQVLDALNRSSDALIKTPENTLNKNPVNHNKYILEPSIELEMVKIEKGAFLIGSPKGIGERREHPQQLIKVPSFYLGKYPITQAQYQAVMNHNPSYFQVGGNYPVEQVTWFQAINFCQKLSTLTGKHYRLPSEAEWEYACCAAPVQNQATKWYFGNDESQLGDYAWYQDNCHRRTHRVGQKKPNQFGLYDLHGNVWEWCLDDRHDNYYGIPNDGKAWFQDTASHQAIHTLTIDGDLKYYYDLDIIYTNRTYQQIRRGGSWLNGVKDCRVAVRHFNRPSDVVRDFGFRVVCVR